MPMSMRKRKASRPRRYLHSESKRPEKGQGAELSERSSDQQQHQDGCQLNSNVSPHQIKDLKLSHGVINNRLQCS